MVWVKRAALAGCAAAVMAAGAAHANVVRPPAAEELRAAAKAHDAGDCAGAMKVAGPLADRPAEKILSPDLAALAYHIAASCEAQANDLDHAYVHALRGTALASATDYLWFLRLAIELQTHRHEPAIITIESMARDRRAVLNGVEVAWLYQLSRELDTPATAPLRKRLLAVATSDAYAPDDPTVSVDGFRYVYAGMLADAGDAAGARALVLKLQSPVLIAEASLDPRLRAFPSEPDVRAAWEHELATDQVMTQAHPDLLEPVVLVAQCLRRLGRPAEALAVLDAVKAKVDDKAYADGDKKLNWYLDSRARSYAALDRYDDAVAALRLAVDISEAGGSNVSQAINLAEMQISFGHADDALKTLSVFDDPARKGSPYGEMEMRFARGCAAYLAGHKADAERDLAFARAHEKDHPEALPDLLLCVGDMDGAAAAEIRRLDDPTRRAEALEQLSDFDPPPANLPPNPIYAGLEVVKTRPDIKAAIARAGGIRRFHIQRDEL